TDAAHALQGIVTWLPQDVDSTPPGGFDTNRSTPSGCTSSPGDNILKMQWSEDIGTGLQTFIADYRFVQTGSNWALKRYTCSGTAGAGPYSNVVIRGTSSYLAPLPASWTPGNLPVAVSFTTSGTGETLVHLSVQTVDGHVVSTDAAPRNTANTLG